MSKRIEKMTVVEISLLPKGQRDALFQESVVQAISQSVLHGNSELGQKLLKLLPLITKKSGAKDALIAYFENWGNFYFNTTLGALRYSKMHGASTWTKEYEAAVSERPWTSLIQDATKITKKIYDADKEFRTVYERLKKVAAAPEKTLLHAVLVEKVQQVLFAYGRTDDWTKEDKRGRTLFDSSTKMSTMRAGKFAKGA